MSGGVKFDTGKLRVDLVPWVSILAIAAVLTHGAHKYGDRNWEKGLGFSRLIGGGLRHLLLHMCGQQLDKYSGLPHLWHFGCNAVMLIYMSILKPEFNDLPVLTEGQQEIMNRFLDSVFPPEQAPTQGGLNAGQVN